MKKRKLFVGVLLASAAFSLAACSGGTADTTTSGTPTTTTTTTTTSGTSTTTTSGTSTTTTQGGTQTDQVTVSFKSKVDGTVVNTAVKEVTAQTIDKGGCITLPSAADMAVTGYKFIGFETATGAAITDTTTFNNNATVYCSYDTEYAGYATLVADTTKNLVAYDFSDKTASDTVSKFQSYGTKGIYDQGAADAAQVSFENRKAKVTCTDTEKGQLLIDLGETITNATVTGCYEIYIDHQYGNNFGYFNLVDENGDPTFKISMRGSQSARVLGYGGNNTETTAAFAPQTKHFVEYSVNLVTKKVTIKLNGTTVVDDVLDSTVGSSIKAIRFEGKTDSSKGNVNLIVDSIAFNKEVASLDDKKAVACDAVQKAFDDYKKTDYVEQITKDEFATIETNINTAKNTINAATTDDEITTAQTNAITALDTAISTLRTSKASAFASALNSFTFNTLKNYDKYKSLVEAYEADYTSDEKTAAEATLATLVATYKTKTFDNCKAMYDASEEFVDAAATIIKEKITVTITFVRKDYTPVTITEFADNVTYFTKGRNGLYEKVKSDAEFNSSTTYYTESLTTQSTTTIKNVKDEALNEALITAPTAYYIYGVYTDANLTTKYSSETKINAAVTYYVEVNQLSIWNVKTDVTDIPQASVATSVNLATGTEVTDFCKTEGTVAQKFNGKVTSGTVEKENTQCIGYEIAKKKGSAIVVTVAEGDTLNITFGLISTGGTNSTEAIQLLKSDAVVAVTSSNLTTNGLIESNLIKVTGTSDAQYVTYTLTAGTYKLVTNDQSRGARVTEIISYLVTE